MSAFVVPKNHAEGACTPASTASALPDWFEEDSQQFPAITVFLGWCYEMPLMAGGLMMKFSRVHHDFVIPMAFAFAGSNSAFQLITIYDGKSTLADTESTPHVRSVCHRCGKIAQGEASESKGAASANH